MHDTLDALLYDLKLRMAKPERTLVAIVGAPGAGKSTLVEQLHKALGEEQCAIVPMDGFHFDNAILDAHGWRPVKGAPHTFDVAGLAQTLERLAADDSDVYIPVFDRHLDLARAGARCVTTEHRLLLVEGNYLLLDQAPWQTLAPYFDVTVYLDVPLATLERRLMQRWLDHGYDAAAAYQKVAGNDLPNAELVVRKTATTEQTYRLVQSD